MPCTPKEFFRSSIQFLSLSILLFVTSCLIFKRNPLEILNPPAFNGSSYVVDSLISSSALLPFFYLGGNVEPKSLLGILLAGLLFHLPPFHQFLFVDSSISSVIRKISFVVILVRGGLSIDPIILKRLKLPLPMLAVAPIIIEVTALTFSSFYLLEFDLLSGLALGFLIAAVSPAVVVPCMLEVEKKGYGRKSGITTLCIAGATLSDVLCITAFSVVLGVIFGSERSTLSILLHVPIEIALGILIGFIGGYLINFCSPKAKTPEEMIIMPCCLILLLSLSVLLGSAHFNSEVLGPVAILALGFFTAIFVKKHNEELFTRMKSQLDYLWKFIFMPLLFGLIGFRMDIVQLFFGESSNISRVALCLLILIVGLLFRLFATYFSILGRFNRKEKIFLAFAWIPKATIQAALATAFLDKAVVEKRNELFEIGNAILLMAVLSIFLSAPLGQFFIRVFSSKLLQKDDEDLVETERFQLIQGR
ncbi:unnamed protein product, partial [Mesorhabditis belari]|uniref:Cation/H+ exchanger transmembrane domain-containing protein n=1 Tax=Mesorhabditis belari TaxID=2138241 RepID=A0AAF3EE39_9BILA